MAEKIMQEEKKSQILAKKLKKDAKRHKETSSSNFGVRRNYISSSKDVSVLLSHPLFQNYTEENLNISKSPESLKSSKNGLSKCSSVSDLEKGNDSTNSRHDMTLISSDREDDQNTCCNICLGRIQKKVTLECTHQFCMECIGFHFTYQIQKRITENNCPQCQEIVPRPLVNKVIKTKDILKRERFEFINRINKDPSLFWCPRTNCNKFVQYEEAIPGEKHQAICSCSFTFCTGCHEPWHPAHPCEKMRDKGLIKFQRKDIVKHCPNCKTIIEKNKGCNHVKCTICGLDFGWKEVNKYDKNSPSKGTLSDDELSSCKRLLSEILFIVLLPFHLLYWNFLKIGEEFSDSRRCRGILYIFLVPLSIVVIILYIPLIPILSLMFGIIWCCILPFSSY